LLKRQIGISFATDHNILARMKKKKSRENCSEALRAVAGRLRPAELASSGQQRQALPNGNRSRAVVGHSRRLPGILFTKQFSDEPLPPVFIVSLYFFLGLLAVPVAIVVGAVKILRLRSYGWSNTSGVLAFSPIPSGLFWPIGLLVGIWALVVLGRDDVKETFREQRKPFGLPDVDDLDGP
jgi:hypothetical protein